MVMFLPLSELAKTIGQQILGEMQTLYSLKKYQTFTGLGTEPVLEFTRK